MTLTSASHSPPTLKSQLTRMINACSETVTEKPSFRRAAHDALGHIHDRMPVIVPKNLQDQWLDPTMMERDRVQHFIDTIPKPKLVPRIVGKEVESVRNNGPELIEPLTVT